MSAPRAWLLSAGVATAALCSAPAAAQVDDSIVLNILRQCAQIDEPGARLACYDNNVRTGAAASSAPQPRAAAPSAPQPGAVPPAPARGPEGFGSESVRSPERFARPAEEASSITAQVASVRQREPGIYLVALEDGAQWLFNEGVASSYRTPRSGSRVHIERGALGSFLLRFDNQAPVPVRRVQ